MKEYQKPEVEVIKFTVLETIMDGNPDMEGGTGNEGGSLEL